MRWAWHWLAKILATVAAAMAHLSAAVKGWRTVAFNAIAGVLPILELSEITEVLPDAWLPWYALGLAVLNMYLRGITTTPVGLRR